MRFNVRRNRTCVVSKQGRVGPDERREIRGTRSHLHILCLKWKLLLLVVALLPWESLDLCDLWPPRPRCLISWWDTESSYDWNPMRITLEMQRFVNHPQNTFTTWQICCVLFFVCAFSFFFGWTCNWNVYFFASGEDEALPPSLCGFSAWLCEDKNANTNSDAHRSNNVKWEPWSFYLCSSKSLLSITTAAFAFFSWKIRENKAASLLKNGSRALLQPERTF